MGHGPHKLPFNCNCRSVTFQHIGKKWDMDHTSNPWDIRVKQIGLVWGRDESKRQRAESQRIVAARPLCPLQYPVAYLSRLQRILPAARWNCISRRPTRHFRRAGLAHDMSPWEPEGPYCGSANGRRAHASLLARILT